jgi:hypothetical protein
VIVEPCLVSIVVIAASGRFSNPFSRDNARRSKSLP